MITDPLKPGYYGKTNELFLRKHVIDMETLIDEWLEEASQAAVEGNPEKAGYIHHMAKRVLE